MKRFVNVVMVVLFVTSLAVAGTGVKKAQVPVKSLKKVSVVQFQSDPNVSENPSIIQRLQYKIIKLFNAI